MSFQVSLYIEGNPETFLENGNSPGNKPETVSLKALANKVLQRNTEGNFKETTSFHAGKSLPGKFPDEETRYRLQERSAIMEYDGGLSRDQADKYAWCREVCILTLEQSKLCERVSPCPKREGDNGNE